MADGSRANPANDLPDATTPQPQRPVTHIQVGGSLRPPGNRKKTNNAYEGCALTIMVDLPVQVVERVEIGIYFYQGLCSPPKMLE